MSEVETVTETEKTVIYTDGGSVDRRGKWYGGWGFAGVTGENSKFLSYGACTSERATNNVAELDAYIEASKYVLKNGIKEVTFKLDSKYVLEGANKFLPNWERNNWCTKAGIPLKNKAEWLSVKDIRIKMDTAGIVHNYEWVKGHSGVEGNEQADAGATKGIKLALAGNYTPVVTTVTADLIKATRKVKQDFTKLLCLRRIPFITNEPCLKRTESDHFIYYNTNIDDKDNAFAKYLGRAGTEVLEAVVLAKKPIAPFATVTDRLSKEVGPDMVIPAIAQWDKISSKNNYGTISIKGEECLTTIEKEVYLEGNELLAYAVSVPRLAFTAFSSMDYKYDLLDSYLRGKLNKDHITDITDLLMETDAKGKQVIIKSIAKQISFKHSVNINGKEVTAVLIPNVNMPQLSKLGSISKGEGGITLSVILHEVCDLSCRFSLIVETGDGDIAIYDSPQSNLRMLK